MECWIGVEPGVKVYTNDINPMGRDPVLFLHGWPANYKMFEYQYNVLCELGIRCIGMDCRGFGNSDKPWSGYNYDRMADDVRGVIDELALSGITLAGHSTGGAIAIRYMARHKAYGVSKLALAAAAAPSLVQRPKFPCGQTTESILKIIKSTYADRPQMLRDFGNLFFYSIVPEAFSDWFFNLGLTAASWATIAVSKAWLVEEMFYDMTQIHVPTLIMQGVHDKVVYYPLAVALNEGIKGSQLVPFENSGHGLFYDEKDKFNRVLAEFAGK